VRSPEHWILVGTHCLFILPKKALKIKNSWLIAERRDCISNARISRLQLEGGRRENVNDGLLKV
jgi:hypothetical protein